MKIKMKKSKAIMTLSLLMLLAGAGGAFCAETANNVPEQSIPQSEKIISPVPTPTPSSTAMIQTSDRIYSYNPLGKPDPFKPFVDVEKIQVAKKAKAAKPESIFPLQRSEVESFRLVGIIGDQTRRLAIVEDGSKRFYPLFIGTRIGVRDGKVTDILADRLTVDEPDGKKIKRIVLKLRNNI